MWQGARILVTEPDGMIGGAIARALARRASERFCLLDSSEVDLRDAVAVSRFFEEERPTHVFLAAGKKGGILANQRFPADLMLDNLAVLPNVIRAAFQAGVRRLLYLGSSCLYPRDCPQPMEERSLLAGPFEPTNEAYSMAKMAALKLCQAIRKQYGRSFISAIPTNIYGPGDDFDPDNAHVVAAMIRKFHDAREARHGSVTLWGTGQARREFIFSEDLGRACVFLMEQYDDIEPINIGAGSDLSIHELAEQVRSAVGFDGKIRFDASKPDGMPRKWLDSSKLTALGWRPEVSLEDGLRRTCQWYGSSTRRASKEAKCLIACS
jgi:GDP-L-fucose synthase